MVKAFFLLMAVMIGWASPGYGEMYRWVDEKGTVHFSDDLSKIPEKYRPNAEMRKAPKEIPATAPEIKDKSASSPASKNTKLSESEGVEVDLLRQGEIWKTEVVFNERVKRLLIVDSGASFILIHPEIAKELDMTINENTPLIPMTTVSGYILAPLVTLRSVRVGKAGVENVEAVIYPMPSGGEGLLGNSFLNKYRVTLDSIQGKMTLVSMKGIPSPDRPGGYGRDFWVSQFRFYRGFLERLKQLKKHYDGRGTDSARTELNRINIGIRYFENQLDEWDRKASHAGVPRNWRE